MALSLNTVVGGASANSYCTLAEADSYHEGHLYASDWTGALDATKIAALVWATRLLDAMPGAWSGSAAFSTQALGWPRIGMTSRNGFALASTVIPDDLKNAEAEYARQLIAANLTETDEIAKLGITSLKAGPVALGFKKGTSQQDAALPSMRTLAYMVPDAVKFLIPTSWLITVLEQQVEEKPSLIFENLMPS